jgi:tol-pal system protein YbgF
VPNLTVVKLSPARTPPPKIDTRTPVVEPDPGVLDALASAAPADSAALEVADAEYQNGLQSLRVGNLEGGVKALDQFAQAHPGHPLADNALYFSGIGDIGLQDWARAADAFASVIARYPAGDAVAEAMLKLADCRVHLHQREEARSLFAKVISTYPGTAAATQAEQRLASISP